MSTAVKVGVGFVIGALLGGGGGFYGGLSLGTTSIVQLWVDTETENADDIVAALELLRAKKNTEATAALEEHLDRHVVGLMPSTRGRVAIRKSTLEEIKTIKKRIQTYRNANPRPETKAMRAKDVDAYLATD